MTIDIRATVTCSLGTLISASVSDDYVQGSGLIKVKGSAVISGILTPDIGTVVTFAYTKGGVTTTLPRKLRVLSSFADPFRRTTTVELGCKLTYLSDLKEPIKWDAFDDAENAGYTANDAKIITLPIHASSVMAKCLTELGITASSSPLTNKFSIAEFDFGPGYVQVLSDLLVSESYCGYLDTSEVLQVFSLNQDGGTGPVLDSSSIIDLGPIGVGQLPGEAVTVSYSSLKLKAPDPTWSSSQTLWERDETYGPVTEYTVQYGNNQQAVYNGRDVTVVERTYEQLQLASAVGAGNWFYWQATGEVREVVTRETKTTTSPSVKGETKYAAELLTNGLGYSNSTITAAVEETTTTYSQGTGEPTQTTTLEYQAKSAAYGALGIPLVFSSTDYVVPGHGLVLTGKTVVTYEKSGDYTKTVTDRYIWGPFQQQGQQGAAEARETFANASQVETYLASLDSQLVHVETTVNTSQVGRSYWQGRPSGAELTNSKYADGGDPDNGWRTESKAELELALGSATAQRRVELSLPYAPDDTFYKSGGSYYNQPSDAEAKANLYGRVQNKLLLGNRNGMNVQTAPESLPSTPFAPVFVSARGYVALYRTNGTSFVMDANGIVASSDLLFMGGVGTV